MNTSLNLDDIVPFSFACANRIFCRQINDNWSIAYEIEEMTANKIAGQTVACAKVFMEFLSQNYPNIHNINIEHRKSVVEQETLFLESCISAQETHGTLSIEEVEEMLKSSSLRKRLVARTVVMEKALADFVQPSSKGIKP